MMPKLNVDVEEVVEKYYQKIRMCKNKESLINVLHGLYAYASGATLLQSDIQYLQDRAKELEFNLTVFQEESGI